MIEVNIHEAKTHLSRLIAKVAEGEEVIIARSGEPVAKIIPIERTGTKRILGQDAGRVEIADDFDAPLDPETMS
ncbi:MAG: type II toxin-antitoxin system Phd/YefM family antitoxin [Thermoanaerobaculia bacterium]